jgi:hypothetical protein
MRVDEAKAALERAGYRVVVTGDRDRFDVDRFGAVNADELVQLAHRHGAWRPAVQGAHSAGPNCGKIP